VTDDDTVAFNPVEIVRAQTDGIWVAGLPSKARIITVGQGFVAEGETVDPRPAEELPDALVAPRTTADPTDAVGDVEAPEGAARPGFGIASPANAETAQ
jgi:multidrug efflux system membrane fusion protein